MWFPRLPRLHLQGVTGSWDFPLLLADLCPWKWGGAVKVLVAQLCPTLCDPMHRSPSGSSVHGILQARILKWGAIPFSRGSSRPRDRTLVSHITGGFFTIWATREAPCSWKPGSKWGCAFLADCSHLQNQSRKQTGNDFPCLWWSSTIGTGYKLEILRGFPGGSDCKQFTCRCRRDRRRGVWSLGWDDPLEEARQPTPVFLPGESHGQRSLAGYSPWGCTELDTTEWLTLSLSLGNIKDDLRLVKISSDS